MERDLGVTLFERSARGVLLTASGQRLYDGAIALFRHVDQVRHEAVTAGDALSDEARIVLASSLAPLLSGQVFDAVREVYPQIRLTIHDLLRVEGEKLITSRLADFGLLPNVGTLTADRGKGPWQRGAGQILCQRRSDSDTGQAKGAPWPPRPGRACVAPRLRQRCLKPKGAVKLRRTGWRGRVRGWTATQTDLVTAATFRS